MKMPVNSTSSPRMRATVWWTAVAVALGPMGMMPAVAWAATPSASKPAATVTLNFVNAEIEGVARAMGAIMNRTIIVDPRVKGSITLYSDQPLTPREAYLNFLAALRGQGFSVVEVGSLLKIVPEAEGKLQTGTVEVGAPKRRGDQIVTEIFKLQHESANNMVTVLRPLISPNNTINANPSTNTLVITDYADNLQRIAEMIAAMDVPSATDTEIMPLQYAIAADLAPVVQKLVDGVASAGGAAAANGATAGSGGGLTTIVMADTRTNSLMVRAPNASRAAMVRGLVQRLDRPGTSGLGGSGIHVVYLKNADAVKLATVLRAAFPSGSGGGGTSGGSSSASGSGSSGGSSGSRSGTGSNASFGGSGMSGSSGSSASSAQSTSPVAASAEPSTGGFIQADPSTNSLVITATDALYRQLRAVIDQLDGRRAQIYIEAMVVEVNEDRLAEAGIQFSGLAGAASSQNGLAVISNLPQSGVPGLISSSLSPTTTLAATAGIDLGLVHNYGNGKYGLSALATFLETKTDANILSKPNMVTLDNEEAKIVVGQNVPYVTGSYTNGQTSSSGSVNPFTTVERMDVGLTLRVKPQVGEGGTVRLTVFEEKSGVVSTSTTQGPTTSKSSIETTVVIDDGQTLVLGGLLQDEYDYGDSQVPVLGDIPILGNLFKSHSHTRNKNNLMVFLRPVVLRSQDLSNELTLDRYEYMRQNEGRIVPDPNGWLPVKGAPQLDPLQLGNRLTMPPVVQPLDDPKAPAPTVLMPGDSRYAPKLAPQAADPASPTQ